MNSLKPVATGISLLAALLLVFAAASTNVANAHHCKGKHASDPACDPGGGGGGGGDPVANPAFAYVRPANGSAKVLLANDDGSAATEIFVGTRFSFAQEPAAFGNASGGKVLIGDFSNLYLINYSVSDGVISVDSPDRIHDRDLGPSAHSADPDWSPDGTDFAFRTSTGSMYIDSRATYNGDGVVENFGDPIYEEDRAGSTIAGVQSIAWDADNIIHFIVVNPGGGTELRSLDTSACEPICYSAETTCIASNGSESLSCAGVEELSGMSRRGHVSVNYDSSCSAGDGPHILVSGDDANGDPITYVLDRSEEDPMFTVSIQNLDGNDWTDHCTFVGSPGENKEGPLHGGAIVEYDPFMSSATITLINRRGQTPDWIN